MMLRTFVLAALSAAALAAAPAHAQSVEVAPLSAPDLFSSGARETGLGPDLWRGASPETLRTVLPLLAEKPLSPAAQALARRVLGTGARGPDGAGQDPALAAARAEALMALGDVGGAAAILARAAGLEQSPELARAAAEAALLTGNDPRACQIAQALATGRGDPYWLRLRAYCQALAGDLAAAQLTFDLAQAQDRDPVFGRLMGAKLGIAPLTEASLRHGLDLALSRHLGLDPAGAEPAPAVEAALAGAAPGPPRWTVADASGPVGEAMAALAAGDIGFAETIRASLFADVLPGVSPVELAILDASLAVAAGRPGGPELDRLVERAEVGEGQARARALRAALQLAALGAPMSSQARGELARFAGVETKAPAARVLALDLAAEDRVIGEAALLALWTAAEAGAAGPAPGDRARIVRALRAAGLEAEARAFALEGLLALR